MKKKGICLICNKAKEDLDEFIEGNIKSIMIKENCCFTCAFWKDKIETFKNNPNWLIVDGCSYVAHELVDKEYAKTHFVGHGGRMFYFKKNDGTLIKSNNVWCQGDISEPFKELIPNNAVFLTKEEYENLSKNGNR